ncbi:MAG: DinB family protein [Jatrophihabitans sp.]
MTWTAPQVPDVNGPLVGADRPILEAFLASQRAGLINKCAGLTGEQLAQAVVPPSNLTLLGLVRHMAKVERTWFRQRFGPGDVEQMYDAALGKDADFEDLEPARAEDDFSRYFEECRLADAAVADTSFDETIEHRGEVMSLRLVYVHMVREYAQHIGHADLLRERIDGRTG